MSLTSFVKLPDVAARLKPFRPSVRPISRPLKVPFAGGDPAVTGTAFDYLLRFELHRRAPHATHGPWIAEAAADLVYGPSTIPCAWVGRNVFSHLFGGEHMDARWLAKRITDLCAAARAALDGYLLDSAPSVEHRQVMAGWAVRLAQLDGVYRRGELDATFEDAPAAVVDELVALLDVVPFDLLVHPTDVRLNPTFGEASLLVGGADADLITGDLLVDFKTTRSATVWGDALDQLFGYFLLARRAGLPPIRRVGVYFSRYGYLRAGTTDGWTGRPDFAAVEEWFFERASDEFGRSHRATVSATSSVSNGQLRQAVGGSLDFPHDQPLT